MSTVTLPSGRTLQAVRLGDLTANEEMLTLHIINGGCYETVARYGFSDAAGTPAVSSFAEFEGFSVSNDSYGVAVRRASSATYGIVSADLWEALKPEFAHLTGPDAAQRPADITDVLTPDMTITDTAYRNESVRVTIFLEHGVRDGKTPVKAENVPGDRGGLTKYGISEKAYPNVDIKNLTYDDAVQIYSRTVWPGSKADILPRLFAFLVFDFYTTSGGNAWRCLQRTVAAYKPKTYTARWDDGVFGNATLQATLDAANTDLKTRMALLNDFTTRRIKFYHDIVDNDSSQKKFLDGWNKRAVWAAGYAQALLKTSDIL